MGRWHDGEGGLAHREGSIDVAKLAPHDLRRYADHGMNAGPVLGSATLREASWSRSNSSWGMSQFKRPNDILAASSGFDQRSMTISVSSRTLDVAALLVEGLPTIRSELSIDVPPCWTLLWLVCSEQ
jgi:hypothetical protein